MLVLVLSSSLLLFFLSLSTHDSSLLPSPTPPPASSLAIVGEFSRLWPLALKETTLLSPPLPQAFLLPWLLVWVEQQKGGCHGGGYRGVRERCR